MNRTERILKSGINTILTNLQAIIGKIKRSMMSIADGAIERLHISDEILPENIRDLAGSYRSFEVGGGD